MRRATSSGWNNPWRSSRSRPEQVDPAAEPVARGASAPPGCRNPSWVEPGSTPAAALDAARFSNRLVWFRPNLNDGGQALHEIHQLRVQERRSHLQAAGHAGPVNLRQDVLGQVGILIQGQRPGKRIGTAVDQSRARPSARPRRRSGRRRPEARQSPPPRKIPASAGEPAAVAQPRPGETA